MCGICVVLCCVSPSRAASRQAVPLALDGLAAKGWEAELVDDDEEDDIFEDEDAEQA
jgi:hypothetical protein